MSASLDRFLPPSAVKPKQDPAITIQDKCANPKCRRKIPLNEPKYTLRIKGKEAVYCQTCAKKILHPHENTEENI